MWFRPTGDCLSPNPVLQLSTTCCHSLKSNQSQSQSYDTTDGQSVSLSWWKAHLLSKARFLLLSRQLQIRWCGAPSLMKGRVCRLQLLLPLASIVILGTESRGTQDHILLSQVRDPKPGGPRTRSYIPHEESGPKVKIVLPPTASRPVCRGVKHTSGAQDQICMNISVLRICWCWTTSLMIGRVYRLQLLLALAIAVILGSESRGTHDHFLLSQIGDFPILKVQVPVFISPRNRVAQLYHQELGSLSVASYDSQGYSGGIRTRLHAG
jgi:hypothetical protein